MRGNSELVQKPLISQEMLCSMEIVMKTTHSNLLIVNEVLHYDDGAIILLFLLFQFSSVGDYDY
jgi:NADH:ubiquinone oxidoreductase subunit K